jgi:hypothetical protein
MAASDCVDTPYIRRAERSAMNSFRLMFSASRTRVVTLIFLLICVPRLMIGAEIKSEDVIARHLDSIGTAEVRAAARSRIVQGTSRFKNLVGGGGGELQGTSALVSDGRKAVLMIKFASSDYRGEQFVTDGDKVSVAATTSSNRRSSFGEFVHSQDQVVREGLIGGALNTSWALLNLDKNQSRLDFDGEKKVDGRPAYLLNYHSRRKDDLTVRLYFDPETYRHIMTTYSITLASGLASSNSSASDITKSASQKETRYTIEERFSDFKTNEGLTLPTKYVIHFTEELQNGVTNVMEWNLTADEVSNNTPLDPRNFQVK